MSAKTNRSANAKWARRAVWGLFVVVMCIGCNPLSTLAFITHDTPKTPAELPLLPHKDSQGETKTEVKVLVLSNLYTAAAIDYAGMDRELVNLYAKEFPKALAANEIKQKIKVIPAEQV